MPGYRRFIAYVYEYIQGKKDDGKGFIKVEVRNGICRMNFKLRGISESDAAEARVYGYVREGGSDRGIFLGKGDLSEGQAEFDLQLQEEQIGGSSYSLGDLDGLLILGENGKIYASGWDEQPVRPDMVLLPSEQKEQGESPSLQKEKIYGKSEESETVQDLPGQESIQDTEPGDETGNIEAKPESKDLEIPEEQEKDYQVIPEEQEDERIKLGEERERAERRTWPEDWKNTTGSEKEIIGEGSRIPEKMSDESLMESQSAAPQQNVFMPFFDEEITGCRKITPADLRHLGRRDRGLINNNFLRFGVKNYGHLMIGKRMEDGRYILGVPGIYERQESLMANMFGFPYFKECTGSEGRRGRFGYWYRLIDTPQF